MSTLVLYCWCHSDSASVLLYFIFLSHLFPLPCGAGSTVPREGFDSSVIMPFSWCCGCDTSYIVSVHIQCQASIDTPSLCRGHSWRVRLAKQETLTPPGHLVSPLVCRGPWMSTLVLYCWCHSDSALVLLYFTVLYCRLINVDILLLFKQYSYAIRLKLTHWWCDIHIHLSSLFIGNKFHGHLIHSHIKWLVAEWSERWTCNLEALWCCWFETYSG